MRTLTVALLAAGLGLGSGLTASALFEHSTTTTRTVTITYHDAAPSGPRQTTPAGSNAATAAPAHP
ncbi:MAG TPA: hypothetical protein VFU65_22560 [Actinocrinis sp.]|nr:hypothetical protein [Actinocrinis sp.]